MPITNPGDMRRAVSGRSVAPVLPPLNLDYSQQMDRAMNGGRGGGRSSAPNPGNVAAPPAGRPPSRFANRHDEYFQMARQGITVGPPKSGNRQPPVRGAAPAPPPPGPGGPAGGGSIPPAQRTMARVAATAPASVGAGGAPAVDASRSMAASIPPGARDLADASAQLQALGLGRGGAAGGMDWRAAFAAGAPGVDASKLMTSGWQPKPGAMSGEPPIDPAVAFGANAPQLNLGGGGVTSTNFDPAAAAPAAGGDLESRRRRAFLDAPDSLEGMRRARLVVADEIAAQGGDLQQFAADSNQMRPMSMKQLEGYLGQVQNGQVPVAAAASAAMPQNFSLSSAELGSSGIDPAVAFSAQTPQVPAAAAAARSPAFSMTAAADQALRARGAEAFKAAGTGMLPYQVNAQVVPGVNGETNPTALSALANAGVDARTLTPPEMTAMYGATNALALGLGAPKAGATTKLPMLTPEQVDAARRMGQGPSFVTPPAGFNFYNR